MPACRHGTPGGTYCARCRCESDERTRPNAGAVSRRQKAEEQAARLGATLDDCSHGTPLTEACEQCLAALRTAGRAREVVTQMAVAPSRGLNPSEAVYGLLGWLTSREEAVRLGAHESTDELAQRLAEEFCAANKLAPCRPDWNRKLVHPPGPPTDHEAATVERP